MPVGNLESNGIVHARSREEKEMRRVYSLSVLPPSRIICDFQRENPGKRKGKEGKRRDLEWTERSE